MKAFIKSKAFTLASLIPHAFFAMFFLFFAVPYFALVLWQNEPEWLAWLALIFICIPLFACAPSLLTGCNIVSIVFQAKALKRREIPWLNILLIIASALILTAILVFIMLWLLRELQAMLM